MKTACVYHAIDLDGWMSAAIVKHWWLRNLSQEQHLGYQVLSDFKISEYNSDSPENIINFIGYNYGQPIPNLSEYDKVIMCDISFPVEEMEKLRQDLQDKFIWIDHHISAIKATEKRVNTFYEGLRDTKFSACELTWKYFFPEEKMPEIVRLLGRYDCFGHMGTDEERTVIEFQYGARECITDYEKAYVWLVGQGTEESKINTIHDFGITIYKYLCTEAQQVYQNGFEIILPNNPIIGIVNEKRCPYCGCKEVSFYNPRTKYACGTTSYDDRPGTFQRTNDCIKGSLKFICINKERFNAINFGIDYHAQGYDGQACFFRTKEGKWSFSFYSQTVDCSVIAKQFGGGGHKGAAGCVVNDEIMLKIVNS